MPKLWLITGTSRGLGRAFTEEVSQSRAPRIGHSILEQWFPFSYILRNEIKCSGWLMQRLFLALLRPTESGTPMFAHPLFA
jgi:hypothetical protein